MNNEIYYHEVSSKTKVDIIGIALSMWKQHNLKKIFTYDDVLNIKDNIGKIFGYIER